MGAVATIVAIIIAVGAAYYVGKISNPASQNVPQENIINSSSSNSGSVVGWQTYQDNKDGYELMYPGEWKFDGEIDTPPSPYFTYRWDDKSYCRFNVVVSGSNNDNEILNLKNKGYSEEKTNVGELLAIKLSKSPTGTNNESQDLVYFGTGLNYYRITRISFKDQNEEKCINTFNQILKTFKFN